MWQQRYYRSLQYIKIQYGLWYLLPVQFAGIEALRHGGQGIHSTCQAYQDRRDVLVKEFAEVGWAIPKSPATMFSWAKSRIIMKTPKPLY